MRKPFILLLALLMVFGLGCFGRPGKDAAVTDEPTQAPTEAPTDEPTEAPTEAPTEEPTQKPTEAPPADITGVVYPGEIYGECYENRTLGYGVFLEGWRFADEGQLSQLNNAVLAFTPNDLKHALKESGTVILMYAESPDGQDNINLSVEDAKAAEVGGFTSEQIAEAVADSYDHVAAQMGIEEYELDLCDVGFGAETFSGTDVVFELNGIEVHQLQIFVPRGDYICIVTITSYNGDRHNDVLYSFYRLPGEYEWGTSIDEIKSAEIEEWMTEDDDWFEDYFAPGADKSFNIYNIEFGYYFLISYNFDTEGRLVSVSKLFAEQAEDDEIRSTMVRIVREYSELYGEPELGNPFYLTRYGDVEGVLAAIESGELSQFDFSWTAENADLLGASIQNDSDGSPLIVIDRRPAE